MTDQATIDAGTDRIYDDTQAYETVLSYAPLQFLEDFIGAGHSAGLPAMGSPVAGYPWVKKIVGSGPPTAALVSNAAGGQAALTLVSTSEKEEATLTWNDNLSLDETKKLNIEIRAALSVPPSASGVQAVWGLAQAWIDGPANNARYLQFGVTANNALLLLSKDGINTYSIAAAYLATPTTQITLDTNFHMFRIDSSNPADIGFYVDGARVNAVGSITWSATAANSIMQPYLSVYKPSGAGLATLTIDKVDIWGSRQ